MERNRQYMEEIRQAQKRLTQDRAIHTRSEAPQTEVERQHLIQEENQLRQKVTNSTHGK